MASKRGKVKGERMLNEIRSLHERKVSQRKIALALGISRNTVQKYLSGEVSEGLRKTAKVYSAPWAEKISWEDVKGRCDKGLKLLHHWEQGVQETFPEISYVSFWREFKRRFPMIPLDFHRVHEPGKRCEFDFKGQDPGFGYTDPVTKTFVPCRLFGNILCFSQLLFAKATHTEKQEDVFASLKESFEYFEGVPEVIGFDNAKAQVVRADRYDGDLNPEFSYFCGLYEIVPLACRPYKPKDKNLIENALGVFWRWAWPLLQETRFYSLAEINRKLRKLLEEFNLRVQRKTGSSRRFKFESGERECLKALPEASYRSSEWRVHKIHADCHIQHQYNFYSAPYEHRGKEVQVRINYQTLEIYDGLQRIAFHQKLSEKSRGRYTTVKSHLPEAHKAILEMTPEVILKQAQRVGPHTHALVKKWLYESGHPLTYLRRCQGLLRLEKRYSAQELENVCDLFFHTCPSQAKLSEIQKTIQRIQIPAPQSSEPVQRTQKENLRGQNHWKSQSKEVFPCS